MADYQGKGSSMEKKDGGHDIGSKTASVKGSSQTKEESSSTSIASKTSSETKQDTEVCEAKGKGSFEAKKGGVQEHASIIPGVGTPCDAKQASGQEFSAKIREEEGKGSAKTKHAGAARYDESVVEEKLEPTIVDAPDFDPVADAKALRAAMKGWGADEGKIMEIITKRSNRQRQEITKAFKKEYGREEEGAKERDLIEDLKKELGGDFEDVIVGLMLPPVEYEARELRKAMKGFGTNERTVVEILLTKTNKEMQELVDVYNSIYETPLEERVCSETSGDLQRLLVLAITCAREEDVFNPENACEQAQSLYNAGEAKLGTDEEAFVGIFGHASKRQLLAVFEEYKALAGVTLEQAVRSEFSGDLKCALLTIIRSTQNRPRYYAERLHKAMEGAGTDDCTLIRILVSRSEIDLGNIKREYESLHGVTLLSAVQSETSGCYKKALCAIIGHA